MKGGSQPPCSVGLGGDGDEIDAIEDVEREFGVTLDINDAPAWVTAGDVFNSLMRASPGLQRQPQPTWHRFVAALTSSTGVDPSQITKESPLLASSPTWGDVTTWAAYVFYVVLSIALVSIFAVLIF